MSFTQRIATKAFILCKGKVLIVRESEQYKDGTNFGKYDLPGGKIEPGERWQDALTRELQEEVGLTDVTIGLPLYVGEWRPIVQGNQLQIIGIFFECHTENNHVILGKDHGEYQWIDPKDYANYPLIENTIAVFQTYLQKQP
ncbi:MAG TPA: NUDIX hydrolase [Candidatus Kapabacteria bacterium]|nr:NUDIX hydrolase [Candidatus Kapabacteria bacterium]